MCLLDGMGECNYLVSLVEIPVIVAQSGHLWACAEMLHDPVKGAGEYINVATAFLLGCGHSGGYSP